MVASAIAAAAPSLISFGLSKAFGPKTPKQAPGGTGKFTPTNFQAGGLRTTQKKGGPVKVTSDVDRQNFIGGLAGLFPQQANLVAQQRARFDPVFGEFTQQGLRDIDRAGLSTISNLKEGLAQRRVAGSSFANNQVLRAEKGIAEQREKFRASSFLQSLETQNALIGQEFELRRKGVETFISELNLQAEVGAKMASEATTQFASNARLREQLSFDQTQAEQKGFGQFAGQLGERLGGSLGDFIGGISGPQWTTTTVPAV